MSANETDSESEIEDFETKLVKALSVYEYIKRTEDDLKVQLVLALSVLDSEGDNNGEDRDDSTDQGASNEQAQLRELTHDDQKLTLDSSLHASNDDQNDDVAEDDIVDDIDPGPSNDQGGSVSTTANDSGIDVTNESAIETINNQLSTLIEDVLDQMIAEQNESQNRSQQDSDSDTDTTDSDKDGDSDGDNEGDRDDDSDGDTTDTTDSEFEFVSLESDLNDPGVDHGAKGRQRADVIDLDQMIDSEIDRVEEWMQKDIVKENLQKKESVQERLTFDCPICMSAHDITDSESFGCSHLYCTQCLSQYFVTALNERQMRDIRCPSDGCAHTASESQFRALLPPELHQRFDQLIMIESVSHLEDINYCPQCNYPVECDVDIGICAQCDHVFCPICRKGFHGCQNCQGDGEEEREAQEGRLRREKEIDESERLISEQYKKCPNCRTDIEKDVGCYHMTCAQCSTDFCWLCLAGLNGEEDVERHYTSTCILFDHDFIKD